MNKTNICVKNIQEILQKKKTLLYCKPTRV